MIASFENNQPILILGMHRSGTSAIAGMLQLLGVYLGRDLLPAISGVNDKGFFEDTAVVHLHEKMLDAIGFSWNDVRPLPDKWWRGKRLAKYRDQVRRMLESDLGRTRFWGVKDPRMCRLLPVWLDIFNDIGSTPKFVIISRSPKEVAHSLNSRDGMDYVASNIMWLFHTLDAYRWTNGYSRSFVKYDELLCDWKSVSSRIQEDLNIKWPIFNDLVCEKIDAFLEHSMRHHVDNSDSNSSDNALTSLARQLYACNSENTEHVRVIESEFFKEIKKIEYILPSINTTQNHRITIRSLKRNLAAEKSNAMEQVEYRDELISEIRQQLAAEKANAIAQVEYRDELIGEIHQQLAAEKATAIADVKYRDQLLDEARQKLVLEQAQFDSRLREFEEKMDSPKFLCKRLVSLFSKGLK